MTLHPPLAKAIALKTLYMYVYTHARARTRARALKLPYVREFIVGRSCCPGIAAMFICMYVYMVAMSIATVQHSSFTYFRYVYIHSKQLCS